MGYGWIWCLLVVFVGTRYKYKDRSIVEGISWRKKDYIFVCVYRYKVFCPFLGGAAGGVGGGGETVYIYISFILSGTTH